jgi:hypothetical protein
MGTENQGLTSAPTGEPQIAADAISVMFVSRWYVILDAWQQ